MMSGIVKSWPAAAIAGALVVLAASGQPAATLKPDPLDAPAATSLLDARRSAEMAREMAGGHGAHGAGTYRQVDAGRGPETYEAEDAEPPGAPPHHHQHDPPGGTGPAPGRRP